MKAKTSSSPACSPKRTHPISFTTPTEAPNIPVGSAYHAMYTIEPAEDFTPIKHPALIMGHYSKEKGLYMDGLIMSVEFTKAPKAPHQQLEITLSFDNGLNLKKEIAIDILELKE